MSCGNSDCESFYTPLSVFDYILFLSFLWLHRQALASVVIVGASTLGCEYIVAETVEISVFDDRLHIISRYEYIGALPAAHA